MEKLFDFFLNFISNNFDRFVYGTTHTQRKRDLCVMFGEEAVNNAEIATSKYVGPITTKILFSKNFEATCYVTPYVSKRKENEIHF